MNMQRKERNMQKKSRGIMVFWALLLVLALSMCDVSPAVAANNGKVKSVTVTNLPSKSLTLKKGKSMTLKVKVVSSNKKKVSQAVTYKSSNTKVASVTNKGKVTARKNGTSKITITSSADKKKKVVITVKVGTPVKAITIDKTTPTVARKKSITLKAKVTPSNASNKSIIWSSSNQRIAKVSSKGKVTGVKNGTAKITAKAADGSGVKKTITVKVGTPVKTITLNKTSEIIQPGQSFSVKATAAPSKATNKKVIWSSSNPGVATVNNSGKVTGVTAGTAKITAAAADGSNAKKTMTVVVKNPIKVTSVSVINASTIKVDLSEAQALTLSNFTVKLNKTGKGNYNKPCKLDNIASADNKSYLLVLDSSNIIRNQENVQVTVSGLWGSNTSVGTTSYNEGTFQYTEEINYSVAYNKTVNEELYFGGGDTYGYVACAASNLPQGVKMEELGTSVRFYGKIQQKGKVVSQLTTVDEVGNTHTYAITWLIGSEDTISAAADPVYCLLNADGTAEINESVTVNGGSGSYTYSLSGETYGLTISENGRIRGTFKGAAGTYTLTVNVQDRNNANYKTTAELKLYVSNSISVSGIVKDLNGNPVSGATVRFENKDKSSRYQKTYNVYTNSNGAFSATLISGIYDIEASYGEGSNNSHKYLYAQQLDTTRSGFDISLALRRIIIDSDNSAAASANAFGTWYDADGTSYGFGDTLYLKEGTYALTSEKTLGRRVITSVLNITVNAASGARATAHVTVVDNTKVIALEQPQTVSLTSEYQYYKFTPTEAGTYYFYSEGSYDTYGVLLDANDVQLAEDDDSGASDTNFYFVQECRAGVDYYIGIRRLGSSNTGTATLHVSATRPSFTSENLESQRAVGEVIESEPAAGETESLSPENEREVSVEEEEMVPFDSEGESSVDNSETEKDTTDDAESDLQ